MKPNDGSANETDIATSLPGKAQTLIDLSKALPVPSFFVLDETLLSSWTDELPDLIRRAERVVARIRSTSAAFIDQDLEELDTVLKSFCWQTGAKLKLTAQLEEVFGKHWTSQKLAIRSASSSEDNQTRSNAGLYRTELNVSGASEVLSAIERVWKSSYSKAAVISRINNSDEIQRGEMAVIIQRMLEPEMSGVAFSRDPRGGSDAIVELVEGLGESLVSGQAAGRRIGYADLASIDDQNGAIRSVFELLQEVASALPYEVDMEWAYDGENTWLLQARPITAGAAHSEVESVSPEMAMVDLYAAKDALEAFKPLPEFGSYFRAKRKWIVDFARQHGFDSGRARVVRLNRLALENPRCVAALEGEFDAKQVVIDASDNMRQIIVSRSEMARKLAEILQPAERLFTVIIREFIRGDYGLISSSGTRKGRECVTVEWSPHGLLSMNRGIATPEHQELQEPSQSSAIPLQAGVTAELFKSTLDAAKELGPIQIEWVIEGGRLIPIDYSILPSKAQLSGTCDDAVLSSGYCAGPLQQIGGSDELRRLSIAAVVSINDIPDAELMGDELRELASKLRQSKKPPIIVTPKPLAALAPLIPYCSGFIFESGSLLCHLAILLREAGLPAVQSETLYGHALEASHATLDARVGSVSLTPRMASIS
ncbi:PEP/pyruvate-binding domain-containing protein [Erythrobacter sp.]|uniref:PEP/pyruvate-binding domain-containing protein n=1 Tax=Erythrobacter sp. TaxID=1042 RepID=UPI003C718525